MWKNHYTYQEDVPLPSDDCLLWWKCFYFHGIVFNSMEELTVTSLEPTATSLEVTFTSIYVHGICVLAWKRFHFYDYVVILFPMGVSSLPWRHFYLHDSWDRGHWWASGGSCRGLTISLHLVGGGRLPNEKDPLRSQGTKREQGSRDIGGLSHGIIFCGGLHYFHGSIVSSL